MARRKTGLLVLLAVACKAGSSGGETADSGAARVLSFEASSPAPSASGDVPAKDGGFALIDGSEYAVLAHGAAFADSNGVVVVLSDAPVPCERRSYQGILASPARARASLRIVLPVGAKGALSPNKPVATHVMISTPEKHDKGWVDSPFARATYEAFALRAGEHVKGRLSFNQTSLRGDGAFDVTLCPDDAKHPDATAALSARPPPPKTTVTGTLAGKPFTPRTILARLVRGGGAELIDQIVFIEGEATCEDIEFPKASMVAALGLGAITDRDVLTGAPQPVTISARLAGATSATGQNSAGWIIVDAASLAPEGKVTGTAYLHSPNDERTKPDADAQIGGRFEATVCDARR